MDSCASFLCLLRNFLRKCLMKTCLAAAATVLIVTTVACSAADLAVKAAPYVAPPPVSSWTGFYVGGALGARWSDSNLSITAIDEVYSPVQHDLPACTLNTPACGTAASF